MKKLTLILFAVILLAGCGKNQDDIIPEDDSYSIYGKWAMMSDYTGGGLIEFKEDSSMKMSAMSESRNGSYVINPDKNPIQLDLVVPEEPPVKLIIRYVDKNTVEMCFSDSIDGERPTSFNGEIVMLYRLAE